MIIRKKYKFRLNTNTDIEQLMFQFSVCTHFGWNKSLDLQKDFLAKNRKMRSYNNLAGCLVKLKKDEEISFLKTAPSQSLQQIFKGLWTGH